RSRSPSSSSAPCSRFPARSTASSSRRRRTSASPCTTRPGSRTGGRARRGPIPCTKRAGLPSGLPYAYLHKLRNVPGVVAVNHYSWFGGIYDEPKNMFPNFGIDPETVAEMWPDYHIDPTALRRFRAVRNAALVGEQTMRKFGWKVGQNVTLKGTAFPVNLTFEIVGQIPSGSG